MESLIKLCDAFKTTFPLDFFLTAVSYYAGISIFFVVILYHLLKAEMTKKNSITLESYFTHKKPIELIRTYPDVCLSILIDLKTERDSLKNKLKRLSVRRKE